MAKKVATGGRPGLLDRLPGSQLRNLKRAKGIKGRRKGDIELPNESGQYGSEVAFRRAIRKGGRVPTGRSRSGR